MPEAQQNITNIPSNRVEFIDSRTGLVSREWYRFFLNLFTIAGSGGNQTSLDDLQIGPPPQPDSGSGGGGGTGTVTSVDMTVPTGLAVSGNPITTAGTLAVTYASGYAIPTTAKQTEWDTAYTDRLKWDGGATGLVAATGRTSLGATTVGGNFFTLPDPSAITFVQINADNTITTMDAPTFRTAIGAGTGGGSVTSVDATGGTGISVTGGPITTSGTLTITNTAPDQVVSLTGAGTTAVTGTYPNFTITSNDAFVGTVTSVGTAGTVSGLTLTGGPITSSGTITLGGTLDLSSPPAIGGTTPAAGTFTTLTATGQTSLGGTAGSETVRVTTGANTGKYTGLSSDVASNTQLIGGVGGTGFVVFSSATNSIRLRTNGAAGNDQMQVAHTASAVNYVQVTGAATTGSPVIYGTGSDTNVSTTVSAKGFSSFINFTASGTTDYKAFAVSTSGASNTGNYLQVKGNAAGTAPVLSSQGSDTNIDLTLTPKGVANGPLTATTTAGTTTAKVWSNNGTSPIADLELQRGTTATWGGDAFTDYRLRASGGNFILQSKNNATSVLDLLTIDETNNAIKFSPVGVEQMRVTRTASAVNYVQVTGAATGGGVQIAAQGSDTNVNMFVKPKGTGAVIFNTGGGYQLTVINTPSAVNWAEIKGGAAGSGPQLSAVGSDTNIDLTLTPKGTGVVRTSGTGIRLYGSSSGYVGLTGAATAGSTTYTLPAADGTTGQMLSTNGSGTLSWATGGGSNITAQGLWENNKTISSNYSVTSGNNALSAGPITVASGVVVTVPSGSVWTIV